MLRFIAFLCFICSLCYLLTYSRIHFSHLYLLSIMISTVLVCVCRFFYSLVFIAYYSAMLLLHKSVTSQRFNLYISLTVCMNIFVCLFSLFVPKSSNGRYEFIQKIFDRFQLLKFTLKHMPVDDMYNSIRSYKYFENRNVTFRKVCSVFHL